MPSAPTVWGNQGGRWLPKDRPPKHAERAARDDDRVCGVCGRRRSEHRRGRCPVCGGPLDHHEPADVEACWAGLARCAAAKRDAGVDLTANETESLTRNPNPETLGPSGYQPRRSNP